MLGRRIWALVKDTVYGFIEDEAMTRGAAIACYTLFSIAPLLVFAIAIAGLAFGEEAVHSAVLAQLRALVGQEGASAVQTMVRDVDLDERSPSSIPAIVGAIVLLVTASGVFAEIQAALNVIWRAVPRAMSISTLLRARLLSIGLVATTGFLLLVSLVASAILSTIETWTLGRVPEFAPMMRAANFVVSFTLTSLLFGAIYKILPDRRLEWRDVAIGAVCTALLFNIGKTVIGWYIGGSGLAASYGATGALLVVLLWVYYSAQVFLLGAEFTRAWAAREGSKRKVDPGAQEVPEEEVSRP